MAYSQDLRERAVAAAERGEHTQEEVAEIFAVSLSSLEKWLKQKRGTGSLALRTDQCGRRRTLGTPEAETVIRAAVAAQPDVTLDELCERISVKIKLVASASMLCRELAVLGLRRKKMLHASEQNSEAVQALRKDFLERMQTWPVDKVKCLDEAGAKLGMTRLYGRAEGQQRVTDHVPKNYGSSWTMSALISFKGIEAPMVLEGAMDTWAFETYVETQVCPTLTPGDIVVMDNLSAHKSRRVCELIEACGAQLEYLPPYSPDLNPIELCWSKVKAFLRAIKAQTTDALVDAIRDGLLGVTLADIRAWFKHDGYPLSAVA